MKRRNWLAMMPSQTFAQQSDRLRSIPANWEKARRKTIAPWNTLKMATVKLWKPTKNRIRSLTLQQKSSWDENLVGESSKNLNEYMTKNLKGIHMCGSTDHLDPRIHSTLPHA